MGRFRNHSFTTPEHMEGTRKRPKVPTISFISSLALVGLLVPSAHADDTESDSFTKAFSDTYIENLSTESLSKPQLQPGTLTDFFLPAGQVSLINLTLTETVGPGYVQVVSGGVGIGETSNANSSSAFDTVATAAFVTPNQFGAATTYNQVGTHLIIDAQGTFSEGVIDVVKPERMFDSRSDGVQLKPGSKTVVGKFKPNSTAVVNITTTDTICDGYIQIMNSYDTPIGSYSNANASKGKTTPKIAIIKTNSRGEIVIYSSCETHAIIDLQAYMNGVDDIADERVIDTRETSQLGAGSILEFTARPNSIAMVSVLTMNSRGQGYVQALPVENPIIGSSSNMNLNPTPGAVVGGFMLVQIGSDGKGRLFFMEETDAVVDIQGYMQPSAFNYMPERILDSRDGTQNRPNNEICEKVVIAQGSTTTGNPDDAVYSYVVIEPNGNVSNYPALGLNRESAGQNVEIIPSTCNSASGIEVIYDVGNYPKSEVYKRNLLTGVVIKVPMVEGKYQKADPQSEGIIAMQTETGSLTYQSRVVNGTNGDIVFYDARDFAISDNGTTKALIRSYFASRPPSPLVDEISIEKFNYQTKKNEYSSLILETDGTNKRVNYIEVSPDGSRVAVLRNNGSARQEISVVETRDEITSLKNIELSQYYFPMSFRLVDEDTLITVVADNGPTGPRLRTLSVNVNSGSFTVIDTGILGIPLDMSL